MAKTKKVAKSVSTPKQQMLASPISLLISSFNIFFTAKNLKYLLLLAVVNFVLTLPFAIALSLLLFGRITSGPVNLDNFDFSVLQGVLPQFIAIIVLFAIVSLWTEVAAILAISKVVDGKGLKLVATYKEAFPKIWTYFVISLLYLLVVLGGIVLLVIPGVVFALWFNFVGFIVVLNGFGVKKTFQESKKLVKGRIWQILYRIIVINLAIALVNIIFSEIKYLDLFVVLLAPLFILPSFLLYKNAKETV